MSLQTSGGMLVIDSTDPQITIGNVTCALKMRDLDGFFFSLFEKVGAGDWVAVLAMGDLITEAQLADPAAFFATHIPALNAYFVQRFGSQGPMNAYELFANYLTNHVKFQGNPPQVVLV